MRSILALVLLSVFMAIPASAERLLIGNPKFVSTHAPIDPVKYAEPTSYVWEVLIDSTWVEQTTTPGLITEISSPQLKVLRLRVHGKTDTLAGPVSQESEEFSVNPNLDCNGDNQIGILDFGCLKLLLGNFGLFKRVLGHNLIIYSNGTGEYL